MAIPGILGARISGGFLTPYRPESSFLEPRYVEGELLVQLFLPLLHQSSRNQQQGTPDPARQDQLAQGQAGLDRLAEADLVAEKEALGKAPNDLSHHPQLVRPGIYRAGENPQVCGAWKKGGFEQKSSDEAFVEHGGGRVGLAGWACPAGPTRQTTSLSLPGSLERVETSDSW